MRYTLRPPSPLSRFSAYPRWRSPVRAARVVCGSQPVACTRSSRAVPPSRPSMDTMAGRTRLHAAWHGLGGRGLDRRSVIELDTKDLEARLGQLEPDRLPLLVLPPRRSRGRDGDLLDEGVGHELRDDGFDGAAF